MPVDGITSAKRVDLSRDTFDVAHGYRAVVALQGRVRTEAEENEQRAIELHRDDVTFRDVIGAGGTPKGGTGFAVGLSKSDAGDLAIGAGRIYVEGVLVENAADTTLKTQPFGTADTGSGLPVALGPATYTVALDVWERDRTYVEDPAIREPALGGPDTTARTQLVWQVSLVDQASFPLHQPGGTLKVETNPAIAARPCALPPTAGYLGLENQLYRIEIHTGGGPGTASFKWSRENGSVLSAITGPLGATFNVASLGPDATLGFAATQWIELLDDSFELARRPGPLVQVVSTSPASSSMTVASPPALSAALHPKIRRWDHPGGAAVGADNAIPIPDGRPVPIEAGIQVTFIGENFIPGSYWLIPARTAIDQTGGNIAIDISQPLPARYVPVRRMALASAAYDGKAWTITDSRLPFPPLTAIAAGDVSYAPGCPDLAGTSTVQDAIDKLCATKRGSCSLEITPGPNWDVPIRTLVAGSTANAPLDINICLAVGDYPLTSTLAFANLGSVKLTGSGKGTRIHYDGGSIAVEFTSCATVDVRDMRIDGGTLPPPAQPPPNPPDSLKGAASEISRMAQLLAERSPFMGVQGQQIIAATMQSREQVAGQPATAAQQSAAQQSAVQQSAVQQSAVQQSAEAQQFAAQPGAAAQQVAQSSIEAQQVSAQPSAAAQQIAAQLGAAAIPRADQPGAAAPAAPAAAAADSGSLIALTSTLSTQADWGNTWYVDETMSGTLTLMGCGDVRIERVWLTCLGNPNGNRLTTCLTISTGTDASSPATLARVRDCDLQVGDGQLGMLLLNLTRAVVEDNTVFTAPTPRGTALTKADPTTISKWAGLLVGGASLATGALVGNTKPGEIAIDSVEGSVHVQTYPELRAMWSDLLGSNKRSATETYGTMQDLARQVVVDPSYRKRYPQLDAIIGTAQSDDVATGARGIAVGGTVLTRVRVVGNAVAGFTCPVTVANAMGGGWVANRMGSIDIVGNRLSARNPWVTPLQDAAGITVGGAQRCLVADNEIIREGTSRFGEYGIQMYDQPGDYVLFRANRMEQFRRAIEFLPGYGNATRPAPHIWRAEDNLGTPIGTEWYLEGMDSQGNVST